MRKHFIVTAVITVLVFLIYSCKKEKPEAVFSISPLDVNGNCIVGVGETVTFTNQSTGADSYEWTFGDGTSSTEQSPTHSYDEVGTYWVTLIAKNDAGFSQAWATVYVEEEASGLVIRIYDVYYDTVAFPWPNSAYIEDCYVWLFESYADFYHGTNYVFADITDEKGQVAYEDFEANTQYYILAYKELSTGYLTNIGLYTNLTTNTPKEQLELYLFPVQYIESPTKLELTVYEEGTSTPIAGCYVYLFDNEYDMENENISDTVASGVTDSNGEVTFTYLDGIEYYYLLYKESGDGYFTNNISGMSNSTGYAIPENQTTSLNVYARYVEPFTTTFNNLTHTDIEITISGVTKTAPVEGSASFTFITNPGSYVYHAETSGKTTGGSQIGLLMEWDYTHYVTGYSSYSTNLSVGSDYFFLYLQNKGYSDLGPLRVNVGTIYLTTDYITIPNDWVQYDIGYYRAFSNTRIEADYHESTYSYVYWESLPFTWTLNQYLELYNSLKKAEKVVSASQSKSTYSGVLNTDMLVKSESVTIDTDKKADKTDYALSH